MKKTTTESMTQQQTNKHSPTVSGSSASTVTDAPMSPKSNGWKITQRLAKVLATGFFSFPHLYEVETTSKVFAMRHIETAAQVASDFAFIKKTTNSVNFFCGAIFLLCTFATF